MISKIRHYTLPDQRKSIYHAIFGSHLTYGCQIWGQSFIESYVKKIQTLQNNAMRLISFAQDIRDHVSPIYANYNLLKIKDLIELKNVLFVHDYLNNNLPDSFDGFFSVMENHDHCNEVNQAHAREIRPPARYNEYDLTETDIRPQIHADHYKFRNVNIKGTLMVPNYNTKRYGRSSLKRSSVLSWNFFIKIFPDTDFTSLPREKLKKIITNHFIENYRNSVRE